MSIYFVKILLLNLFYRPHVRSMISDFSLLTYLSMLEAICWSAGIADSVLALENGNPSSINKKSGKIRMSTAHRVQETLHVNVPQACATL